MFIKITYLAMLALSLVLAACGGSGSDSVAATEFSVQGVKGTLSGQNVTLDLSSLGNCAVDLKAMVVNINASGYTISPDPTAARDYSAPVEFTLTAPDGTKAVYKVTVTGAACLSDSSTSTPTPTPTPTACTAAPINPAEPYSLVFKGCDASNVATYYDKTECVRQNSTGLIWQGHTPTGLRSSLQYYSNHDDVTKNQKHTVTGGALPTVVYVKPTQAEVDAPTNSIGFRNAVNGTKLCGSQTWRMPTQPELSSLIKTGELPTIDNLWFPNSVDWIYWTSSPVPNSENYAMEVNFNVGISTFNNRTLGGNAVRLVTP